ncbi:MAG: hypothetical protein ABIO36_04415, partial [Pyrinomonadaceae bacterium]
MNNLVQFFLVIASFFILSAGGLAQKSAPGHLDKDIQDLAATERAFSATAVKEGFRDSFIKFFADDGIGFG